MPSWTFQCRFQLLVVEWRGVAMVLRGPCPRKAATSAVIQGQSGSGVDGQWSLRGCSHSFHGAELFGFGRYVTARALRRPLVSAAHSDRLVDQEQLGPVLPAIACDKIESAIASARPDRRGRAWPMFSPS